ncbi:MAG: sigma-54-dependent Fis family transcriptional regulator [Rhodovibrio sp.]|nr:sigma-54-dependent Fis family transcriptional regulator [Rhodovibrio sp.]
MPSPFNRRHPPDFLGFESGQVNDAWERYNVGEQVEGSDGLRSEIHQSWVRSTAARIDPQSVGAPAVEEALEKDRVQQANQPLCRAARGALDKVGQMLHGAEAMLLLTDAEGLVIEAIGDPKTLEAGRQINLQVGGLWTESAVGTNGIGTALWSGKPMFVHGEEHYVETLKSWSCAAAPIRHPLDRSVIGAVDLSGLTKIFRQHNIAFAAAAAGEIEAALIQEVNEERIRLLEAMIGQVPVLGRDDGLLILDRAGRVLHRSGFERLILADGTEMDTRMGRRVVELSDTLTPDALSAQLASTLDCREVSSLVIDGEVRGVALVLNTRASTRPASLPAPVRPLPVSGPQIVGECPMVLEAVDLARRIARVNAPVLVQGETGTGKELFARLIHSESAESLKAPFVAINCGAISRDLFGSELFGHVHGAFTGASKEGKAGKLELANGGVFCLDEIGEMPLEIQPYLLRVLEERLIYRIGSSHPIPFNARLVALTNRDLRAEAEAGRFRHDLYYRIGAVTLQVPPLRDRGADVLLLLEHFNHLLAAEFGLAPLRFSDEIRDLFLRYHWPGNVRELRNLVQRLHPLCRSRDISMSDLPQEIRVETPPQTPAGQPIVPEGCSRLKDSEKAMILEAIDVHRGNLSRVAATLGITRPTLYRKLKLYGIQRVFR